MLTESEWLNRKQCDSDFLQSLRLGDRLSTPPHSARKKLLFACRCLHLADPILTDSRSRIALEVLARYAEGQVTQEEVVAVAVEATAAVEHFYSGNHYPLAPPNHAEQSPEWWAASEVALLTRRAGQDRYQPLLWRVVEAIGHAGIRSRDVEGTTQVAIATDIFGNPFRPIAFSPDWRTDTAVSLARRMYESRDFSPMPILADALQDAGCETADVLDHCRDPNGVHVRGCWVVDLVLGKQ